MMSTGRSPKRQRAAKLEELGVLQMAIILVAPVVAAALFYVWAEVTSVRLGYLLSQAGEAHNTLVEENRGLRIEVAALKAPERLKRIAQERFHLAPPRLEQVVRLGTNELGTVQLAQHQEGSHAQ
jgi:cell division protein FtsL